MFQQQKFLMDIKFFCWHPLLQARSSGNIWREELEASLAARFKKQRLQDSFMLGCREWEWAAWLELVGVGRSREFSKSHEFSKLTARVAFL